MYLLSCTEEMRCDGILPCNAAAYRGVFCVPSGEAVSEQQFSIDDLCPCHLCFHY